MNKLLIVLLAVCLVSTHAFVKRDVTATSTAAEIEAKIEEAKNKLDEITKQLQEQVTGTVDTEEIKKIFNDFIDAAAKTFENLKPTETPKPAA